MPAARRPAGRLGHHETVEGRFKGPTTAAASARVNQSVLHMAAGSQEPRRDVGLASPSLATAHAVTRPTSTECAPCNSRRHSCAIA
jgi:hypothetical protein